METTVLTAPDISCHHCAAAIKKAVSQLVGVSTVEVDVSTKKVTVSFEPDKVSISVIESAMEEEGYPVAR
jgi:copper chaperone